MGKTFLVNGKTSFTSHQIAIETINTNIISNKYLFQYLKSNKNKIMDLAHYTTGLGCIQLQKIKGFQIKVPSFQDQEKIVKEMEQLDSFYEIIQKQIKDLEILAEETLERHLKADNNDEQKDGETEDENEDNNNNDVDNNTYDTINENSDDEIIQTNKVKHSDDEDDELLIDESPKKVNKKVVKKVVVKKVVKRVVKKDNK